jgi:hypothetical protein
MNPIRVLRWALLLLLAPAGLSVASDAPGDPGTQTVSGEALLQETMQRIRQVGPIPRQVEPPLRGLPAVMILRRIGKPKTIVKGNGEELWYYLEDGAYYFRFVVRAGRLESITGGPPR